MGMSKSQLQDLLSHRPHPHPHLPTTRAAGQPGIETLETPTRPTQRRGCYSEHRRAIPEPTEPAEHCWSLRSPRVEIAAIRATSLSPAAPLPHPRLSLLRAVTATNATAVCVAVPALTSLLAPWRAARRAWRAVPGSHTRGGGTRGAECSGALSLLSSSPAQRSALRGTPARPGLPSQSEGTPPPLVATAASASSDSSLGGRCRRDQRHLGSDGRGWGGNRGPQGPIADQVWP